jgi:hypothetical protein
MIAFKNVIGLKLQAQADRKDHLERVQIIRDQAQNTMHNEFVKSLESWLCSYGCSAIDLFIITKVQIFY